MSVAFSIQQSSVAMEIFMLYFLTAGGFYWEYFGRLLFSLTGFVRSGFPFQLTERFFTLSVPLGVGVFDLSPCKCCSAFFSKGGGKPKTVALV